MDLDQGKNKEFVTWMIPRAGAAVVTGAVGYLLSAWLGLSGDLKTVAVGVFVLLGALAITFTKTEYQISLKSSVRDS